MRIVHVILFGLAIVTLLISAATAGGMLGDIFWRAGIAILLVDLVAMRLWPATGTQA